LAIALKPSHGLDQEALRLCANVHKLDLHIMNVSGTFENSKCGLVCILGGEMQPLYPLDEGFACHDDETGICRKGQCVNKLREARQECARLHNLNLEQFNTTGTGYSQDGCALDCYIAGQRASSNAQNEGNVCDGRSGICHNGQCIEQIMTPTPTTTNSPSVTHPPEYYKNPANLKSIRITHVQVESNTEINSELSAAICIKSEAMWRNTTKMEGCTQERLCKTSRQRFGSFPVIPWTVVCDFKIHDANDAIFMAILQKSIIDNKDVIFTWESYSLEDVLNSKVFRLPSVSVGGASSSTWRMSIFLIIEFAFK